MTRSLELVRMNQAVILAGGQATRMRPFTDDRPKAMVEVAGKPIVEHEVKWLAANGVQNIVISCGYRSEVLKEHLTNGDAFGVSITYAIEDEPLGRGGGLKFAAKHLPFATERWVAVNGDIVTDFPVKDLVDQHDRLGAMATIALAAYQTSWGIADLEGDLIKGFIQSPKLPYWINAGVYCFEPAMAELLPAKGDHEDSTFPELARAGKLGAYKIQSYWRGIDTAKDINEATKELSGS